MFSNSLVKSLNKNFYFTQLKPFKIYTRTGDKGTTSLIGGKRCSKDDEIFFLLGDIDELNSYLGVCCTYVKDKNEEMYKSLTEIQDNLYHISAYIASNGMDKYLKTVQYEDKLEVEIDKMDTKLPALKNFIHPGGCIESSHLHVARAISRRVERKYVTHSINIDNFVHLKFFNRLSDYLFTCARYMNHINKTEDVIAK